MEGKLAAAAQGHGFGEEEQDGKELLTNTNTLLLDRFLASAPGGWGGLYICQGRHVTLALD